MEIDIPSLIILTVVLSFFFVPIIYFECFKKRATKKITTYFNQVAQNNNLVLSQFEVWRDQYGIGIDTGAKKIMYLNQANGQNNTVILDLSEINKCRISKEDEQIKTPDGVRNITSWVALRIEFLSLKKTGILLEFYKGKNGDSVRDEFKLAEKWSKIINSKLTNR
tara:strand:- start:26451 stop:26948 length:498 start_codon:yes stop_codon:yes gene_type:complete